MVTVNPVIVPFDVTSNPSSTTVAVLLLMVFGAIVPVTPKAVEEDNTVIEAPGEVTGGQLPLVTTALKKVVVDKLVAV